MSQPTAQELLDDIATEVQELLETRLSQYGRPIHPMIDVSVDWAPMSTIGDAGQTHALASVDVEVAGSILGRPRKRGW